MARLDAAGSRFNQKWIKDEIIVAVDQADVGVESAELLFEGSRAVGSRKTTPENYDWTGFVCHPTFNCTSPSVRSVQYS